jgi:hypothetical protein
MSKIIIGTEVQHLDGFIEEYFPSIINEKAEFDKMEEDLRYIYSDSDDIETDGEVIDMTMTEEEHSMSAYEQLRMANIARNKARLKEIMAEKGKKACMYTLYEFIRV